MTMQPHACIATCWRACITDHMPACMHGPQVWPDMTNQTLTSLIQRLNKDLQKEMSRILKKVNRCSPWAGTHGLWGLPGQPSHSSLSSPSLSVF